MPRSCSRRRRVRGMRSAVRLVVVALVVVASAGCGGDREERTFACSRGFRASDWSQQRLMTGQSVAKCGWLQGWDESRVLRALGRPETRYRQYLGWTLRPSTRGIGPMVWKL